MAKKTNNFRNLFFIRRRPKLGVPIDWTKPSDAEYQTLLEYEGFISPRSWKDDNIDDFPMLKQDLADLQQHMMEYFWELNQKALHYQNQFYLYQWVFMFGALATTALGAFTTYAYTIDGANDKLFDIITAPQLFGIFTAIVSGVTAFFNVISNQSAPQARWATARRLAEELRVTYYRYIARLAPFDGADRVQKLRQHILTVRRKENESK